MNVLNVKGVTRTTSLATGDEVFVHTTLRAPLPHTRESAALNIVETKSINLSRGGQVGQWGEGAYAYEGTLAGEAAGIPLVQFSVPKGTAIEKIAIPGQRPVVRLVPAEGDVLPIVDPRANLSTAEAAAAATWLGQLRALK